MMAARFRLLALALASLALAACTKTPPAATPGLAQSEIAERLRADIAMLASDEFAGRKPGTPGGRATQDYLEKRFGEIGLVSGTNDPGSYWLMPVDLVQVEPLTGKLTLGQGRRAVTLSDEEAAVFTPRRRALAAGGPGTGVPVVFVGLGDGSVLGDALAGAAALMLADPGRDTARREALFRQRATAVVTVVADAEALAEVRRRESRARVELASDQLDTLSAYITDAAVAKVVGPRRWQRYKAEAGKADFAPLELNLAMTIEATADRREFPSQNVIGKIPGSAPGSGAVLLLAHWDHLGDCGPPSASDHICNGAADNASGVAMMLELARRLKAGPPLARDIYVLAVSAEEDGLLGTYAFLKSPPLPIESIVAAFNFDMMAVAPAGSPLGMIGAGRNPALDAVIGDAIARQGRVMGDQSLADSYLQRQDGWALIQAGVPAVLLSSTYGSRAVLDPFIGSRYHRPSDEAAAVELGGAVQDLLLHEDVIRIVADPARFPAPAAAQP
ncbi:M28 family peptidase [Porphyrobacter sp. YT40]|uniref:M28 family peptidase n=1 Tax=Porphyrobacter sp. YT40 TaxID=2547601 RepID=UPI0011429E6E|nr:M28 family peptidase [Porphyrobacter sp. YT40]QDH34716.1 M28 family peptidase [Porphyrobacter sp. YT40]